MKTSKTFVISYIFILCNLVLAYTSSAQTTYYSRGAGGKWSHTSSWTLDSDGSGPEASSVPTYLDNIVVLAGSTITIDLRHANGIPGESLADLGFTGTPNENQKSFYQVGNITIKNGGTLSSPHQRLMTDGELLIQSGGTLDLSSDFIVLGQLLSLESSIINVNRDLILSSNAELIINTDADIGDDLYIDRTEAIICGTGSISIGRRARKGQIKETNQSDALQQICDTFVINCRFNCGMATGNSFEGNGTVILPVELLSFEGHVTGNSIKLDWATAMEEDFDFFTVERAGADREFKAIGTVQGQGNSSVEVYYSFTDEAPLQGQALYRLKATDIDGSVEYHRIIAVYFDGLTTEYLKIYPNPVSGYSLQVETRQLKVNSIVLMDLLGQTIISKPAQEGANQLNIPVGTPKGVYLLILKTDSGQPRKEKVVIL